jgi:hypothetical protein
MTRRLLSSGAGFLPPVARPLLAEQTMACSHGPATAADMARGQSVAARNAKRTKPSLQSLRETGVLWLASDSAPRKGSVVRSIETPQVAQPEGQEPGPKYAPCLDAACLLQCLYLADRCDRNCAGCAATATARREGAPLAGKGAAERGRQSAQHPDGNHGDNEPTHRHDTQ